MTYYLGKDLLVYITTENANYGVNVASGAASAALTGSAQWIKNLGVTIPATASKIYDVEGIDMTPDKEREDIDFLGRVVQDHITIRKIGELTINRKMGDNKFAICYDDADGGVVGTTLNLVDEQTTTDTGYRVYVAMSGTGSGGTMDLWYTFRNCLFTSHKVTPTPAKTTVEAITFKTNIFDVSDSPVTIATTEDEL